MDEPRLSPSARAALETYRASSAVPLSAARSDAVWRSAVCAARPPRGALWRQALAFTAACLVGAVGFSLARDRLRPEELQATEGALWHREGDTVHLELGRIRVQPGRARLTVRTPHLQLVVHDAAVLFDVSRGATVLAVESGEVIWRTGRLKAGERTIVTPAASMAVPVRGAPIALCEREPGEGGYERCLTAAAEGSGMTAEAALYELALLAHEQGESAQAIARLRSYLARFPNGVLGPEAAIALMLELNTQGNHLDAAAEANAFLARFPGEPRAADVRAWSAQVVP